MLAETDPRATPALPASRVCFAASTARRLLRWTVPASTGARQRRGLIAWMDRQVDIPAVVLRQHIEDGDVLKWLPVATEPLITPDPLPFRLRPMGGPAGDDAQRASVASRRTTSHAGPAGRRARPRGAPDRARGGAQRCAAEMHAVTPAICRHERCRAGRQPLGPRRGAFEPWSRRLLSPLLSASP